MQESATGSAKALDVDEDLVVNQRDAHIVLGVLTAVDRDSGISQRTISRELGIALGLANAYLKRCVRKGLIKMTQAPLNRYAYYLTPQGFHEKSQLTVEYLRVSFDFFRNARRQCTELFEQCDRQRLNRLALYGRSELAEAAILSAAESTVRLIAVIDRDSAVDRCGGLPVVPNLADALAIAGADGIDAVVLTDLRAPQTTFDRLVTEASAAGLDATRILAPTLLNISRTSSTRSPAGADMPTGLAKDSPADSPEESPKESK